MVDRATEPGSVPPREPSALPPGRDVRNQTGAEVAGPKLNAGRIAASVEAVARRSAARYSLPGGASGSNRSGSVTLNVPESSDCSSSAISASVSVTVRWCARVVNICGKSNSM